MNTPPFKPTHGRLLVRRDAPVTQTEAGITLAPGAIIKPTRGQIIAAASDLKSADLQLAAAAGAFVHFPTFAGTDLILNDVPHLILLETEIHGFET